MTSLSAVHLSLVFALVSSFYCGHPDSCLRHSLKMNKIAKYVVLSSHVTIDIRFACGR